MPEYDLVIRGGTIVDGTGIPRYRADLAVKHGRVAMISGKIRAGGAQEHRACARERLCGARADHRHSGGREAASRQTKRRRDADQRDMDTKATLHPHGVTT